MLRHALPVAMMPERGPRRTGLSVWRRSTDQGSATATPAEPTFDAGPPSPPPAHPPGQRRFNFLVVGLTILLAAALVGGLLLYNRHGPKPAAANQTKVAVQQAFLTYYSALEEAYKQLDVGPLLGFVTSAGLKQEQVHMAAAVASGSRYRFTADHDLQVAVYSGDLASVDDILIRHTTTLDPASLAPIGAESTDTLHVSYGFKKERGRWLLDSVTLHDSSYLLDVSTGKPVPGTPSSLLRQSFELKMANGQWKVDLVSLV
jgi:hypothetical protein